ncbi:hypothetical protein L207DRAFT_571489, partial [Hyaloscypha variabilis F]
MSNSWNPTGARNRAAAVARNTLLPRVAGWAGLTPAQQRQMRAAATSVVAGLYVGYTQGQLDIPYAATRGAVAAAAAVGMHIQTHRLPRGAADYLTQQGIFAGWGPQAPLPANAFFPPLAPPPAPAANPVAPAPANAAAGPVAAAVAAPVAAPGAPVNLPAGGAASGGGGEEDEEEDDDEEDGEEEEREEGEGEGEG